jgi:hypothetical protein
MGAQPETTRSCGYSRRRKPPWPIATPKFAKVDAPTSCRRFAPGEYMTHRDAIEAEVKALVGGARIT